MPTYAQADDVRSALGLPTGESSPLSTAEAERLIVLAEDRIDGLLEGTVEPDTGRKVNLDEHEEWQLEKLTTATARLAARFSREPHLIDDLRWQSTGGEFPASGPLGEVLGPAVLDPLRDSGLLTVPTSSARMTRTDDVRGAR